jgi:hypothetical protein
MQGRHHEGLKLRAAVGQPEDVFLRGEKGLDTLRRMG